VGVTSEAETILLQTRATHCQSWPEGGDIDWETLVLLTECSFWRSYLLQQVLNLIIHILPAAFPSVSFWLEWFFSVLEKSK